MPWDDFAWCLVHKSYKTQKWTSSCIGNFEENMDLSRIYLAVQIIIYLKSVHRGAKNKYVHFHSCNSLCYISTRLKTTTKLVTFEERRWNSVCFLHFRHMLKGWKKKQHWVKKSQQKGRENTAATPQILTQWTWKMVILHMR